MAKVLAVDAVFVAKAAAVTSALDTVAEVMPELVGANGTVLLNRYPTFTRVLARHGHHLLQVRLDCDSASGAMAVELDEVRTRIACLAEEAGSGVSAGQLTVKLVATAGGEAAVGVGERSTLLTPVSLAERDFTARAISKAGVVGRDELLAVAERAQAADSARTVIVSVRDGAMKFGAVDGRGGFAQAEALVTDSRLLSGIDLGLLVDAERLAALLRRWDAKGVDVSVAAVDGRAFVVVATGPVELWLHATAMGR